MNQSRKVHREGLLHLFQMAPSMKNMHIIWASQDAVAENFPSPLKISKFCFQTGECKPTIIKHTEKGCETLLEECFSTIGDPPVRVERIEL